MKRKIFFVLSLCLILCMGFLVTGCSNGKDGTNGTNGIDGKSAYQIWIDAGHTGTEAEFLAWLQGTNGKSAYEIWIDIGHTGTEDDFIDWLKGENANTPLLRVDIDGYWEVSYDNGETYTNLYIAARGDITADRYFTFSEMSNGYKISAKNINSMPENVVLPTYYNGKPVVKVDISGFENCTKIKSIVLPRYMTQIRESAFKNCTNLTYVYMPLSLNYIDFYAFENTTLVIDYEGSESDWSNVYKGAYGMHLCHYTINYLGE